MKSSFFLLILLLTIQEVFSQTIIGHVLDGQTREPLMGVSVYFDGTTIGSITNEKGAFKLESSASTQATLVVSYLGYETQFIASESIKDLEIIYLAEKVEALDTVILETDPWPRKRKMDVFKREFLGIELSASSCKILNEEAIELVYQPSTKTLWASCDVPVRVINKYLGYELKYSMVQFEVHFKESFSDFAGIDYVYYSGTSIFSELKEKPKKKYLKNRKAEYFGSSLHFMRALRDKRLNEEGFDTYIQDTSGQSNLFLPVKPYDYLEVQEDNPDKTKVVMKVPKVVIQYKKAEQSALMMIDNYDTFYIDQFGIHQPVEKLFFSGVFGYKRMAALLPLDYSPDK